jgi:hypothetical protein
MTDFFLMLGLMFSVSGLSFALGRLTKPTKHVTQIVGYERGPKGRFQKALVK